MSRFFLIFSLAEPWNLAGNFVSIHARLKPLEIDFKLLKLLILRIDDD